MDGNRRWAASRGLTSAAGHKQATEKTIKPIIEQAIKLQIPHVTFWAFSSQNRQREKEELKALFNVMREALKSNVEEFKKKGVKIQIIGDLSWFPKDIMESTRSFIKKTKKNRKITVTFALNYGGREEILRAVNKILKERIKGKRAKEVDEREFERYLDTAGLPDPDLIVRTGGEMRLSGYFPWQSVYSELYFSETLWPDFTPEEFAEILNGYAARERRFGKGRFSQYKEKFIQKGLLAQGYLKS